MARAAPRNRAPETGPVLRSPRGTSLTAKVSTVVVEVPRAASTVGRVSPQRSAIVQMVPCGYSWMALKMVTMLGVIGDGDRELGRVIRAWEIVRG